MPTNYESTMQNNNDMENGEMQKEEPLEGVGCAGRDLHVA